MGGEQEGGGAGGGGGSGSAEDMSGSPPSPSLCFDADLIGSQTDFCTTSTCVLVFDVVSG